MDNSKLFVGNISHNTTEEGLKNHFSAAGEVKSVKIITDNFTGRSRGFGFVEMSSPEEATRAIQELNDKECDGRSLRVDRAKSRETRGGNGGGGDRDRGGFGRSDRGGNDRGPRRFTR